MVDSYRNSTKWIIFWSMFLLGVAVFSLLPTIQPPREFDFFLHVACYFILAMVPLARFELRKAAIICAGSIPVLGLALEYFQRSIAGRDFSTEDMLANNIGTVTGIAVGVVLRFTRKMLRTHGRTL